MREGEDRVRSVGTEKGWERVGVYVSMIVERKEEEASPLIPFHASHPIPWVYDADDKCVEVGSNLF